MMQIQKLYAHPSNYTDRRGVKKYIVFHYTGNVNDKAVSNCKYFSEPNRGASAHFFVDDTSIWCSVDPDLCAHAVGVGKRGKPYINQPMYKVITNTNSISIEMCGSKTSSTASERTITNAISLCKYLMIKYNIPFANIYRHWDVTGKQCPLWLVDQNKWNEFKDRIKEQKAMDYHQFTEYMERWLKELREQEAGSWSKEYRNRCRKLEIMEDKQGKSFVTREELATVVCRILDKM